MKKLKRILYFFYYLKETDYTNLLRFIKYSSSVTGKSSASLIIDAFYSIFRYNISLKDYFIFRFFNLNRKERSEWAGSGYMYEYQLIMNPPGERTILEDKIRFLNHFRPFVKRKFAGIRELESDNQRIVDFLGDKSGKIVLKGSHGQIGAEVEVRACNDFSLESLIGYMKKNRFDLIEQFVIQHHSLMALSPSGLNTIRIFTQLNDNNVDFLGARLRISVNSFVDNMAAGNLAAPIDIEKGYVCGPGVYSDITLSDEENHPLTGQPIKGFIIPFWQEVCNLAVLAAKYTPGNRSVGWDIAITEEGPELIEGNHNWCKNLWQLPVKKGLKNELTKYL